MSEPLDRAALPPREPPIPNGTVSDDDAGGDTAIPAGDVGPASEQDAEAVKTAMGKLLDDVQRQTQFPTDNPEQPPSSMTYAIAASLNVDLQTQWTLFPGFALDAVRLGVAVNKQTSSSGKSLPWLDQKTVRLFSLKDPSAMIMTLLIG